MGKIIGKHKNKILQKRQWGTEKRTEPLSIFHDKPSTVKLTLSRVAIVLTIIFWLGYIFSVIIRQLIDGPQNYNFTMEAFSYSFVVSLLTFSSLMYLIARQGALQRFSKHIRTPRAVLDKYFANNQPAITVLVPSYNEEYQVIRKTLLSAALQEIPNLQIVLLLDDNPFPTKQADMKRLKKARALNKDITSLLTKPSKRFTKAFNRFKKNNSRKKYISKTEVKILSSLYKWASDWLSQVANEEEIKDHVDVFFVDQVLRKLTKDFRLIEKALNMSIEDQEQLSKDRAQQLYRRLVWTFTSKIKVFERKKYISLSHEANKAMNLNAYIGLMGNTYSKEETPNGTILVKSKEKSSQNITIPDSEFLLTLDADSILLREYCLRLVYFMQQPENVNVAISQTPYSSFRGAYSRIERLAGATTDIQHLLHQGMSQYDATFWVGANAIIRKSALEDIVEKEWIDNFEVNRYIQDRTVIEDTESSIDLTIHGWRLMNYPERLSYSATPPDFGSLIVQRRRWANGGLLILPKLWSRIRVRKNSNEVISLTEILLRVNYMASIAWATFGLIFLLAYPYNGRLLSPLVLLAAIPYFLIMASDLKYSGYKYSDVFSIYGFNLIMLPVNFAGVFKSIEQAMTGKKIPFARTPKIKDRTPAPLPYVIVPLFIVGFSVLTAWRNIETQTWGNAFFAGFNAIAASWAIIAYIGIANVLTDSWFGLTDWLYIENKAPSLQKKVGSNPKADWKAILYHGEEGGAIPHTSLYDNNPF